MNRTTAPRELDPNAIPAPSEFPRIRAYLRFYKVTSWITGILLLLLVVEMVLKYAWNLEIELGGYQKVAVLLMRVLAGVDAPTQMVLNVRNSPGTGRLIRQLSRRSVVEVTCDVGYNSIRPRRVERFHSEFAGIMVQVRACDELLLRATEHKDPVAALRAFAIHPLVDSLNVARSLLNAYCERIPGVAEAIGAE